MLYRTISAAFVFALSMGVLRAGAEQPGPLPDTKIVMPEPPAAGQITITPEVFYVIASDVPLIILTSPDLVTNVAPETGPITFKGRFCSDPSKVTKKTFTEKFIYTLEPLKSGAAEIIVVPVGVQDAKLIKRQSVLVNDGTGPLPPPDPDAAFKAKVEAAYKADTNISKPAYAKQLAAIYREGASNTVNDPKLKSKQDLLSVMSSAAQSVVPLPGLRSVREVIAAELNDKLGTNGDAALTQDVRSTAVAQFNRMAAVLEGLK